MCVYVCLNKTLFSQINWLSLWDRNKICVNVSWKPKLFNSEFFNPSSWFCAWTDDAYNSERFEPLGGLWIQGGGNQQCWCWRTQHAIKTDSNQSSRYSLKSLFLFKTNYSVLFSKCNLTFSFSAPSNASYFISVVYLCPNTLITQLLAKQVEIEMHFALVCQHCGTSTMILFLVCYKAALTENMTYLQVPPGKTWKCLFGAA